MAKKKERKLKVNCSYEPNRLAASYLKEAYEQLVPASTRIISNSDSGSASHESKPFPNKENAT